VFGACVCLPKLGGTIGEGLEHLKNETRAQTIAPGFEAWLNASRNSAIGTSSPIPPHIRQALTGYIDPDVMNRARYKVGDNGILNLANLSLSYGDNFIGGGVAAVTLVDVIVFQNVNDAANYVALWAHELTHVKQFRDWGTRDFAIRYARNPNAVEGEAYAAGRNYDSWRSGRTFPPGPAVVTTMQGYPPGTTMTACGCWGPYPTWYAPEPRCQSRSVRIATCAYQCAPGHPAYGYLCQ
jgi:hypothetical protein